jgi:hypothetical protein
MAAVMPFVAAQPQAYVGQVVGDGHCVAYVRAAASVPHTSSWIEGEPVWPAEGLPAGTAIATFNAAGRYANATDGSSHAAIFLAAGEDGMSVYDQWVGRPVARRMIYARGGVPPACDDADAYSVIEVAVSE